MKVKKSRIRCYECGATYNLDLGKIPENAKSFKCVKCGKPVPILSRLVKRKEEAKPKESQPAPAAVESKASQPAFDLNDLHGFSAAAVADEGDDGSSWLALYGDIMSILLIFFILMFAISTIDQRKFKAVVESVSQALGGKVVVYVPEEAPPPEDIEKVVLNRFERDVMEEKSELSELREQMEQLIHENRMEKQFSLMEEDDGLVLLAQDVTMFDLGSAEIRAQVRPFLERLGFLLRDINNEIVIEGHTDDRPIRTDRIASNWELSVMRATNVVHLFLEECGLDPTRLKAAGYAYYRPRYAFDSVDRDKNRRIEIVIKKRYSDELVERLLPGMEAAGGAM